MQIASAAEREMARGGTQTHNKTGDARSGEKIPTTVNKVNIMYSVFAHRLNDIFKFNITRYKVYEVRSFAMPVRDAPFTSVAHFHRANRVELCRCVARILQRLLSAGSISLRLR